MKTFSGIYFLVAVWCAGGNLFAEAGLVGDEQPKSKKPAVDSFERAPKLSGYIQAHYRYALKTGGDSLVDFDDFRVQRVRIGVEGRVMPWLAYDIEIDPRAPEITGLLRDAFITLHVIPRHRLRIGQQKMQFGYENIESSRRLFAVNRSELSDNLSRSVNLRDVGIGILGNLKLGGGFRIEDAVTIGNGAGMNVQADNTSMKNVWGRLGARYKRKDGGFLARLGISGGVGDQIDPGVDSLNPADDFRLEFQRLGTDVEMDHRWYFLSAEYVRGWDTNVSSGEKEERSGYYVNVIGKTPWNAGPIARYDVLADEFKRWTLGAFYGLPIDAFRVLLNYELRLLKDGVRGDDKIYVWTQVSF